MSLKAPPSFGLIKRDQKEVRLREFITGFLASRASRADRSQLSIVMLARSVESPVAKAVLGIGAEAAGIEVSVRAAFATIPSAEKAQITASGRLSDQALQIRWARDVRLMDAHEQLVLDGETSWIGDCMRREPAKHDAFEVFAAPCAETARRTAVYFERIWNASEPIIDKRAAGKNESLPTVDAASLSTTSANALPTRTVVQ